MDQNEVWKDASGYGGRYKISNTGKLKSFARKTPALLKCSPCTRSGYRTVQLWMRQKCKVAFIHSLVLEAFVGNRPDGYVCNHKDGNKLNNNVHNLEWVTCQENAIHSLQVLGNKHGNRVNHRSGEDHGGAKLTETDVREIRGKYKKNQYGVRRLAKEYAVRPYTIHGIVNNNTWKELL